MEEPTIKSCRSCANRRYLSNWCEAYRKPVSFLSKREWEEMGYKVEKARNGSWKVLGGWPQGEVVDAERCPRWRQHRTKLPTEAELREGMKPVNFEAYRCVGCGRLVWKPGDLCQSCFLKRLDPIGGSSTGRSARVNYH